MKMKEYKAGEQIVLKLKSSPNCYFCFFEKMCNISNERAYPCKLFTKDSNVIFVEKKGK